MWRQFQPVIGAAIRHLGRCILAAGISIPVFAAGSAAAEESVDPFLEMPLPAIQDRELEGQFGLGLAAPDGSTAPDERLAVILWDEAKPRRLQPSIAGSTDSASASARIAVSVGTRPSR